MTWKYILRQNITRPKLSVYIFISYALKNSLLAGYDRATCELIIAADPENNGTTFSGSRPGRPEPVLMGLLCVLHMWQPSLRSWSVE